MYKNTQFRIVMNSSSVGWRRSIDAHRLAAVILVLLMFSEGIVLHSAVVANELRFHELRRSPHRRNRRDPRGGAALHALALMGLGPRPLRDRE